MLLYQNKKDVGFSCGINIGRWCHCALFSGIFGMAASIWFPGKDYGRKNSEGTIVHTKTMEGVKGLPDLMEACSVLKKLNGVLNAGGIRVDG